MHINRTIFGNFSRRKIVVEQNSITFIKDKNTWKLVYFANNLFFFELAANRRI